MKLTGVELEGCFLSTGQTLKVCYLCGWMVLLRVYTYSNLGSPCRIGGVVVELISSLLDSTTVLAACSRRQR